jgi:hypothetical protein
MDGLHEMAVLDPSGHTRTTWDSSKPDEVAAARHTFNELVAKRYRAFRVKKDGGEGEPMTTFDPNAEAVILVPPVVGG